MEQIEIVRSVRERRDDSHIRKVFWGIALGATGIGGVVCGIAGLLLSLLAAEGIVDSGSGVRLVVPILIVLSLTSFMGFAHAMDRLQETKDRR